jgi:hypothetical protein
MGNLLTLVEDPNEVLSAVDDARSEVRYIVTDFPVELIKLRFKERAENEGEIYIPEYQRALAWTDEQASYLIESLILRVPVPPIFLYDVKGRLEIVDGSQRIRSLIRFCNDEFQLSSLERLDILNGYRFSDIPLTLQRRLMNTPIRSFVMDESTDASTRVDLFRRLNTSGKKLQDAEIRKGAFQGVFLDLVVDCSRSDLFKELTGALGDKIDPASERQELVTRFFVYSNCYLEFRHDVRKFLDSKMIEFNENMSPDNVLQFRAEFDATLQFIRNHYPRAFFRGARSQRVPRVRFEAVAVGTNLALRANANLVPKTAHWLESTDFKSLVRTDASNSAPKLRARIEYVRDALLSL